jgi:hypothetical protein
MSNHSGKKAKAFEAEIDFKNIQDVIFWAKKWEVSPHQLMEAFNATKSNSVNKIEEYLRGKGFAV